MNMSQDDKEKGTVTGRLPSQPEIQFLKPPGLNDELTKSIEESQGKVGFITGIDFGGIELAILSAMVHGKGMVIVDSIPDSFTGQGVTFVAIDEFLDDMPEPTEPLDKPKLKQNGRSADYLKHNKVRKRP